MRFKIVQEIVTTEEIYVDMLHFLTKKYIRPLAQSASSPSPLLTPQQMCFIFSNIADILNMNEALLKQLQPRFNIWTSSSTIGDIFVHIGPFLRVYILYCGNYPKSSAVLSVLSSKSSQLSDFLKNEAATSSSELDLSLPSLLVSPMQRIPRYEMLLRELLRYTSKHHPDFMHLTVALELITGINIQINSSIKDKEGFDQLLSLQKQFVGYCPPIVSKQRKLLREGTLYQQCKRAPKQRQFFLFSDCIIYGDILRSGYKFRRQVYLRNATIKTVADTSKIKYALQILGKQKSFIVCAKDSQEKEAWINDITVAKQSLAHSTNPGNDGNCISNEDAPIWVPDYTSEMCMSCNARFTLILRRHHCRKCGHVVCGYCSEMRYFIDSLNQYARVCGPCYTILTQSQRQQLPVPPVHPPPRPDLPLRPLQTPPVPTDSAPEKCRPPSLSMSTVPDPTEPAPEMGRPPSRSISTDPIGRHQNRHTASEPPQFSAQLQIPIKDPMLLLIKHLNLATPRESICTNTSQESDNHLRCIRQGLLQTTTKL
ncbi:protein piccolo [Pelomyxa schiedti]|nr:protein piccolo [Pelomyxa schiedti]